MKFLEKSNLFAMAAGLILPPSPNDENSSGG